MAKKNTDHKTDRKGKSETTKSPEKATPAKQPKPLKNKKKTKEPLNRKERQQAAWLRKSQRKAAQTAVVEVSAKASAGLTYAQLEASGLIAKPSKPKTSLLDPSFDSIFDPILDQALRQMVTERAQQFESADELAPTATSDPEPEIIEEPLGVIGLRNVLETEVHQLLERTRAIFNTYCGPSILTALLAAEDAFEKEPEDSSLRFELAEVILADDLAEAIEDFLESIWSQILELQIVASSLEPESELEKSVSLKLIEEPTANRLEKAAADEAVRLDLAWRLAGLTLGIGKSVEIDETFAELIAESKKVAEAQWRKCTDFRRTLSQRLQEWKGREGQRPSAPGEVDEDEFLSYLSWNKGYAAQQLLLLNEREAVTTQANQLWAELKDRLTAGANDPELAVAQNAMAMKNLLGDLVQLRSLRAQLDELDREPESAEGASWINQLKPPSKSRYGSRGPCGMRNLPRQIRLFQPESSALA